MRTVEKACACVLRPGADGPDLLVFDHPLAGTQLPKGTVEPDETSEAAVLRELAEETGLTAVSLVGSLGEWRHITGAGPEETGEPEEQVWDIFALRPTTALPERWQHHAVGSAAERGLVFACRWVPVAKAAAVLHPLFRPVAELLQLACERELNGEELALRERQRHEAPEFRTV